MGDILIHVCRGVCCGWLLLVLFTFQVEGSVISVTLPRSNGTDFTLRVSSIEECKKVLNTAETELKLNQKEKSILKSKSLQLEVENENRKKEIIKLEEKIQQSMAEVDKLQATNGLHPALENKITEMQALIANLTLQKNNLEFFNLADESRKTTGTGILEQLINLQTNLNYIISQYHDLLRDFELLEKENSELKDKNYVFEIDTNNLKASVKALETQLDIIKHENVDLRFNLSTSDTEKIYLQNQISTLNKKIEMTESNIRNLLVEIDKIRSENLSLKSQVEILNSNITTFKTEILTCNNKMSTMGVEKENLEKKITNIEQANQDLTVVVKNLNINIADLKQESQLLTEKITSLNVTKSELEVKLNNSLLTINTISGNSSNAAEIIAAMLNKQEMEIKFVKLDSEIKTLSSEKIQLENEIKSLKSLVENTEVEIIEFKEENELLKNQVDSLNLRISALSMDIANLNEEKTKLEIEHFDTLEKLENSTLLNEELQVQVSALQKEKTLFDSRISAIYAHITSVREEVGELVPKVRTARRARSLGSQSSTIDELKGICMKQVNGLTLEQPPSAASEPHYFHVESENKLPWQKASDFCYSHGMELLKANDLVEMDWIASRLGKKDDKDIVYWVGSQSLEDSDKGGATCTSLQLKGGHVVVGSKDCKTAAKFVCKLTEPCRSILAL